MSLFPFGLRLGTWDLDSGLSIWFLSLNVDYSCIYKSLKTANKYHLSISQLPLLSQVPLDDLSLSELFSCEAQLNTCTCDLSVCLSVRLSVVKTEFLPFAFP